MYKRKHSKKWWKHIPTCWEPHTFNSHLQQSLWYNTELHRWWDRVVIFGTYLQMRRFLCKGSAVLLIPHIKLQDSWYGMNQWQDECQCCGHSLWWRVLDLLLSFTWRPYSGLGYGWPKPLPSGLCSRPARQNLQNVLQLFTLNGQPSQVRFPWTVTLQQKAQRLDTCSKWTCTFIKEQNRWGWMQTL